MRKNFNSVQMLKSSENCEKFSKSVSYETLVGGTTTIGMDRKQTQRLCEYCAYKPLTAVGTLTSLLCNSVKVVEKWLQISPLLRLVKVLGLVAVLSFTIISESRAADCPAGKEYCGDNCCYTIENGTVNFSRIDETKKAVIKRGTFGNKNLSGQLVIPDWINAIETNAFRGNNLTSVILPDTISHFDPFVFADNPNLKEIVFPDSITADKVNDAFFYDTFKGITIKCKGDMKKCQDNLAKFKKIDGKCSLRFSTYCYDLGFDTASEEQCNSTNYYWTGTECVYEPEVAKRTCTYDETGYVKVGNYCYSPEVTYAKKQYTPAEAAQWLRDGNDNFVVLTFKK